MKKLERKNVNAFLKDELVNSYLVLGGSDGIDKDKLQHPKPNGNK